MRRLFLLVLAAVFAVGLVVPSATSAQTTPLCFPGVPSIVDCIDGRFREYWEQNGQLAVFGYPITPVRMQSTAEGTFLTQTFERNRFEPHPEKARPYDVLLGRLGAERLAQLGRNWQAEPRGGTSTRLSMICANRWRRGPIAGAVPRKMLPQYVSSSFGHTPEQSTQATAVSLEARSA